MLQITVPSGIIPIGKMLPIARVADEYDREGNNCLINQGFRDLTNQLTL